MVPTELGITLTKALEKNPELKQAYEEDEAVKVLIAENNSQPLSRPGDSVNIWPKERFYVFEPHIGRSILTFDIPADDNYQEKDIFILKLKFSMLPQIHKQYPHVTHFIFLWQNFLMNIAIIPQTLIH